MISHETANYPSNQRQVFLKMFLFMLLSPDCCTNNDGKAHYLMLHCLIMKKYYF